MAEEVFSLDHPLVLTFGILGNIISFAVYLAPLLTFLRVYKNKSTQGFHSVPYVVALFSSMLWMYYALLKTNAYLLITINCIGCVVESIYILLFIVYAPKKARMLTVKLVIFFNICGFCLIVLLTHFLAKGSKRIQVVGWLCVAMSASVFAAPLSIMKLVIRTKSVEFMPFSLSFFLTLSAIMWLLYGLLLKDLYITLPNVVGVVLGVIQMVLYLVYKNSKKVSEEQPVDEELAVKISPSNTNTNTNSIVTVKACVVEDNCDDIEVGK